MIENSNSSDFMSAHGKIPVSMKNDYLFRALMQTNNQVLIELTSAVLHIDVASVKAATILNPIILGDHISDKEIILDVNVLFDDNSYINLEMQVTDYGNWEKRSLYYLCRNYARLEKGDNYINLRPSIQIGFLDYSLFPDNPEFCASYRLRNDRTFKEYSDNLRIFVVDLTQIDLATAEDKVYQIDKWAKLFQSTTWEEIQMLAAQNNGISQAAASVFNLTADEAFRIECQMREDYLMEQSAIEEYRKRTEEAYQKAKEDLARTEAHLSQREIDLKRTETDLKRAEADLERRESDLKSANAEIERLKKQLADNGIKI